MIISIKDMTIVNNDDYNTFETSKAIYYWKGLFYCFNNESGYDSICFFANYLEREQYNIGAIDFNSIYGSFVLLIRIKDEKEIFVITDNMPQSGIYCSNRMISDHLIEIASNDCNLELDFNSICEYLSFGQCQDNKTLIKGVSTSKGNTIYWIKEGNLLTIEKKLKQINNSDCLQSPKAIFKTISQGLKNNKCSLALTGGVDSRYLLVMLNQYCHIDTCISGNNNDHLDVTISKKVADCLKIPYKVINVEKPIITEEFIKETFKKNDASYKGFSDYALRLNELFRIREMDGYTIHITGDTGVLHKDEEWVPEYPFYNKRKTNVIKYYNEYIKGERYSNLLTKKSLNIIKEAEKKIITWLEDNKKEINTKSFDWYQWTYKCCNMRRNHIMANSNANLLMYCPLLEPELVRYSFNIDRKERVREKMIRNLVSLVNPDVAKIPTAKGMTLSNERKFIIRDRFYASKYFFKQAYRYLFRILTHKTFFVKSIIDWSCEDDIRNLDISYQAFEYAKTLGIIREDSKYKDIPFSLLNKLLVVLLLNDLMNNCNKEV